ncbi:MAG TPA: hypothetical protein VGG64_13530 [Pirellulales bacterium]|jgi:hypothetical protein
MSTSHGRNAVLIVTTADGWKPASLNAVPVTTLSSRFLARRLPLWKALAFAEGYNRERLPGSGTPDGSWALCVCSLGIQRTLRASGKVGAK